MEIIIRLSQNKEEEYLAAVELGKTICEVTQKTVLVTTEDESFYEDVTLNTITCEEDDHEANLVLQQEDEEMVNKYIYPYIEESIVGTNKKLEELKQRLKELKANKPKLGLHSAEDVDDLYQAKLEWTWEVHDLEEEIDHLEYELEILCK